MCAGKPSRSSLILICLYVFFSLQVSQGVVCQLMMKGIVVNNFF